VTIIGNLLDNAFDAVANMSSDRREVILRVDDRGGALLIEVTDHGEGLPDDGQVPIFDSGVTVKRDHGGLAYRSSPTPRVPPWARSRRSPGTPRRPFA
jgi:two-component system CitB family sensor kinase